MMTFEMELGIMCLIAMLLGAAIDRCLPRRAKPSSDPAAPGHLPPSVGKAFGDAPVPVDLGYDPENPINAGRGRETVEIDGATWYLMK